MSRPLAYHVKSVGALANRSASGHVRETPSGGNFGMLAFAGYLHKQTHTVYNTLQERENTTRIMGPYK